MKLNLGCGKNRLPDHINVDRLADVKPDLVFDLNVTPWPWENDSVDEIYMSHVLEHLGETTQTFLNIIVEIHRILKLAGKLTLRVPHPRSDGFTGDPTHVRPITPQLMSLFSRPHCDTCVEKGWANTPLAHYLGINLELKTTNLNLLPRWGQQMKNGQLTEAEITYAVETFNNVVDEIEMTLYKLE